MFVLKKILFFVIFVETTTGQSLQWIPVTSSQHSQHSLFQNYVSTPLQVMTPPALGPLWVKVPQSLPHSFSQSLSQGLSHGLSHGLSQGLSQGIVEAFTRSPDHIDFRKPKTQTFYKSTLVPEQQPVYEFRYKVHDPKEENYQEKSETRVGDSVRGYYSVRDPDGYIRLVKYVSDENGFKTQVSHHHADDNGAGYLFKMTRHVT